MKGLLDDRGPPVTSEIPGSAMRRRGWRVAFGIVLFAIVAWRLGVPELLEHIVMLAWWGVPLSLVCGVLLPVIYAWRWQRLLRPLQTAIPLRAALQVTVAASAANYLLPAFGWAPVKVIATRRWFGIETYRSVPTIAVEHALDIFVLSILAVFGLVFSGLWHLSSSLWNGWRIALSVTALSLGTLLVLWLVARNVLLQWGHGIVVILRSLHTDPGVWGATLSRWLLEAMLLVVLARASGVAVPWWAVCLYLGLPGLAGLLSPVPGGLGVREGVGAAIATLVGASPSAIGALLIWQRTITLAGLALAGLIGTVGREKGL